MNLRPAIPEVPVGDLAPALAYYRDRLGYTVDWSNEDLGLAGVSQGSSRLFIAAPHYRAHLSSGDGPVVIWFDLPGRGEVDQLYKRWHVAGARLDLPPALNQPWSLYEFLAFDRDGNILRVYHFISAEGSA